MARRTAVFVCLCALLMLGRSSLRAKDRPGIYHVRSSDRRVVKLIHEGYARSRTFRQIIDAIERTNVMVYVQTSSWLPSPMRACLRFAGTAGDFRYLRVLFLHDHGPDAATALIGHELQHVLEVGGAVEIVDAAGFENFYRRQGHESVNGFDTETADRTGQQIQDELRHAPR